MKCLGRSIVLEIIQLSCVSMLLAIRYRFYVITLQTMFNVARGEARYEVSAQLRGGKVETCKRTGDVNLKADRTSVLQADLYELQHTNDMKRAQLLRSNVL